MTREEIEHLGTLARIQLSEAEARTLSDDISGILTYVSAVNEIVAETAEEKKVGAHHTVLREDTDPHEPGLYSEALLREAPERDRNYIKVKKILGEN